MTKNRHRSELGIILPLFSVVALSIVSILAMLALNSYIVRQATADLRSRINSICAETISSDLYFVGSDPLLQTYQNSQIHFAKAIKPINYVELESVHFLIPNMPENQWFDNQDDRSTPYRSTAEAYSALIGKSCSGFAASNDHPENTRLNSDCLFYGDVKNFPAKYLLSGLINNTYNARNTLACAASAKVQRILLDSIEIHVSSVYKKDLRGHFPNDHAAINSTREISEMRGLILAIAPQLTTNAANNKFQFSKEFSQNLKVLFDPLNDYQTGLPQSQFNVALNQNSPQLINLSGLAKTLTLPDRISAKFHAADWVNGMEVASKYSDASQPDDYREFLTSCMNPLLLARNSLLTTLVELFQKHGSLRSSTEILVLGTKHRNVASEITASMPNQPNVIVPFGADLLRPDLDQKFNTSSAMFQLPYVIFHSGDLITDSAFGLQKPPAEFGNSKNGMIDPSSDKGLYSKHQALIANQLRYCYHLYTCTGQAAENCSGTISRFVPEQVYDPVLDPSDYQPQLALRPKFGSNAWDRDCPFGLGGNCSDGGGEPASKPKFSGLTAAELVATLGSIQSCPYQQVVNDQLCSKPEYNSNPAVNMSRDLQPDLLGLIRYLSGIGQAVTSPGFGKLSDASLLPEVYDQLANPNIYKGIDNLRTPVIILTHQLPHIEEVNEIAKILESDQRWIARPISIIFMPFESAQEFGPNGLERFEQAFKLKDTRYSNKLYVFSPTELGLPLTSDNYQRYWQGLIETSNDPLFSDQQSTVYKALNIFNANLEKVKRIL